MHKQAGLRIAAESGAPMQEKVKALCLQGRGRSPAQTIETLNAVLQGWMHDRPHTQGCTALE